MFETCGADGSSGCLAMSSHFRLRFSGDNHGLSSDLAPAGWHLTGQRLALASRSSDVAGKIRQLHGIAWDFMTYLCYNVWVNVGFNESPMSSDQ